MHISLFMLLITPTAPRHANLKVFAEKLKKTIEKFCCFAEKYYLCIVK